MGASGLPPSQAMANPTKGNETMKNEKAAALTAAKRNQLQHTSYREGEPLSKLKSEIGTLLLCLQFPVEQRLSQVDWGLFERLLREYVDLVHSGGTA